MVQGLSPWPWSNPGLVPSPCMPVMCVCQSDSVIRIEILKLSSSDSSRCSHVREVYLSGAVHHHRRLDTHAVRRVGSSSHSCFASTSIGCKRWFACIRTSGRLYGGDAARHRDADTLVRHGQDLCCCCHLANLKLGLTQPGRAAGRNLVRKRVQVLTAYCPLLMRQRQATEV
jgi:hypothetical protein